MGAGSWKSSQGSVDVTDVKTKGKTTGYTMAFKPAPRTYTINSDYEWQDLVYLPITKENESAAGVHVPKADMPEASLRSARIVRQKGVVVNFVLDEIMYKVKSSSENIYKMVDVATGAKALTVTITKDSNTNVPYIIVGEKDLYGYLYRKMDSDEFQNFLSNQGLFGSLTVCPISFAVGPMVPAVKAVKAVKGTPSIPPVLEATSRTSTLFVPDMSDPDGMGSSVQPNTAQNYKALSEADTSFNQSAAYLAFSAAINNRVYKSASGRFFAKTYKNDRSKVAKGQGPYISYFNRAGWVDLQTGALFDDAGNAMGSSLTLDDFLKLLNTLQVSIAPDKKGNAALYFRTANVIAAEQQADGVK